MDGDTHTLVSVPLSWGRLGNLHSGEEALSIDPFSLFRVILSENLSLRV
jgi:hypothetical protein